MDEIKPENRNLDGTFKEGYSGNPGGRLKNSMKGYVARKLAGLSDEEKEEWLKAHGISGIDQWKMSEGQPAQDTNLQGEITVKEFKITDGSETSTVSSSPEPTAGTQG